MTRLLGIDPGLNLTGYACVELTPGSIDPHLVEAGVIRMKRTSELADRLVQLDQELGEIIEELRPSRLVVESLFSHNTFRQASLLMGHARGVILLAAARRGVSTGELAPAEVKRAVTGNGRATKEQVQHAVMMQCGLAEPPDPPDVADAIAIALCAGRRSEQSLGMD